MAVGRAGGCASAHRAVVLFKAQTPAGGSAKHLSVAPGHRGSARQFDLAAHPPECAVVPPVAARRVDHDGRAAARLPRHRTCRRSIHFSDRYIGEHGCEGTRRNATGVGEATRDRVGRSDVARRCGDGDQFLERSADRAVVHRQSAFIAGTGAAYPRHGAAKRRA